MVRVGCIGNNVEYGGGVDGGRMGGGFGGIVCRLERWDGGGRGRGGLRGGGRGERGGCGGWFVGSGGRGGGE